MYKFTEKELELPKDAFISDSLRETLKVAITKHMKPIQDEWDKVTFKEAMKRKSLK